MRCCVIGGVRGPRVRPGRALGLCNRDAGYDDESVGGGFSRAKLETHAVTVGQSRHAVKRFGGRVFRRG